MAWKKVSAELRELLEESMLSFDCQKRFMFGSPTYFVNNNMFAGIHQDTIIIRLSEKDREEVLSTYDEAMPFEPMEGRIMKEYIALPESVYKNADIFRGWLDRSYVPRGRGARVSRSPVCLQPGIALRSSLVQWFDFGADHRSSQHRDHGRSRQASKHKPYALVTAPRIEYPASQGWADDGSQHVYAHY
jgi:TfoX/Sxy family transcriptional regulator of competence genes